MLLGEGSDNVSTFVETRSHSTKSFAVFCRKVSQKNPPQTLCFLVVITSFLDLPTFKYRKSK